MPSPKTSPGGPQVEPERSWTAETEEQTRRERRFLVYLVVIPALPIAGWIAGATAVARITSNDLWTAAWVSGLEAQVLAVPFMASTIINALLWAKRPSGTKPVKPSTTAAIALVYVSGFVWIGSLFGPVSWQFWASLISGTGVAVFSTVVCVGLVRFRRHRRLAVSAPERLAQETHRRRQHRRNARTAAGIVVFAAAAGAFVSYVPYGSYSGCEVTGTLYDDAGHITIDTANCGDFALRGNYKDYNGIDSNATYSFTTRGYTILPWAARIVDLHRAA